MDPSGYRALADLVLLMHVGFVAFMVIGLLLVALGGMRGWRWVRNPWFRAAHLAGIGLVVVQSWLGMVCPLTTLEMHLRDRAGDATYTGTFMGHWLRKILFYQAPSWVFVVAYALFGLLVLATWITVRPRPFRTLSGSAPRSAA
jgi:polyferredoxin